MSEPDFSETEIQDYLEKLKHRNQELEAFAYVASHDLQEPIRLVMRFSQLLLDECNAGLNGKGKEYLGIIHQAGLRMHDMVEDLLAYARLDSEQKPAVPFAGDAALTGALENLKELVASRKAAVTHDKMPELYGNSIQLMRLLQNLIANAIKYQPQGNVPIIHIGVEDCGDAWHLTVRDNGLGIDEKHIEHIFQPFRRLHAWNEIKGTGLGLSICKKIVESHGGTIWAKSILGKGSVFGFSLPKPGCSQKEVA